MLRCALSALAIVFPFSLYFLPYFPVFFSSLDLLGVLCGTFVAFCLDRLFILYFLLMLFARSVAGLFFSSK